MKIGVPGIDVEFWRGTKKTTSGEADRGYIIGPGIFLTFPATPVGRKTMVQTLDAIGIAFNAGHSAGTAAAKKELRKWLEG